MPPAPWLLLIGADAKERIGLVRFEVRMDIKRNSQTECDQASRRYC